MVANIIVLAVILLLSGLCLKKLLSDMKKGGCSGCTGNCSGCHQCTSFQKKR